MEFTTDVDPVQIYGSESEVELVDVIVYSEGKCTAVNSSTSWRLFYLLYLAA